MTETSDAEADTAARQRAAYYAGEVRRQLAAEPWPGAPDWRPPTVRGAQAIEVDPFFLWAALQKVAEHERLLDALGPLIGGDLARRSGFAGQQHAAAAGGMPTGEAFIAEFHTPSLMGGPPARPAPAPPPRG